MTKRKWIKHGPHAGTRNPHGGPAKTARGRLLMAECSIGESTLPMEMCLASSMRDYARICESGSDRPPRGMQ